MNRESKYPYVFKCVCVCVCVCDCSNLHRECFDSWAEVTRFLLNTFLEAQQLYEYVMYNVCLFDIFLLNAGITEH